MVLKARAKINWALKVCGLRPDGYHEVDGVMQSIALHDLVRVEKAAAIYVDCPDVEGENLAAKASRLFFERTGIGGGATVHIQKNIPVQAGLGGGSADAAAVLFALDMLYETGLGRDLDKLARNLGADVPFCLQGGTARARGVGEILQPLSLGQPLELVLMKPAQGLCTREIFEAYDRMGGEQPDVGMLLAGLATGDIDKLALGMGNSLERAARTRLPVIGQLLDKMRSKGISVFGMSGSGPTVFGVVESGKAWVVPEDIWVCRTRTVTDGLSVVGL
ncbi:MAG: 4-(cytidine 5'-diphospho)-2-C-methyl-D-erythritol kinase [Christensenellales bacterium]|jgi:4-diphosphocytidyl-2-C-methyl-D-erythritol kinase